MRSQDTTDLRPVCLPFWMAREITLDLVEKERLEAQARLMALEVSSYRLMVSGLEEIGQKQALQLELLQRNNLSLGVQLQAERAKKTKDRTLVWMLRMLAAFGIGWLM